MEIIKINLNHINQGQVEKISNHIKDGKVIAMPFDTSYGLVVDATNKLAVERLYKIKERDRGKPVSVVVRDYSMLEEIADVPNENIKKILLKYLPGKVTFVLGINNKSTSDRKEIGIRIPKFKLINDLAWEFGRPFTATSANISGEDSCMSSQELVKQFENKEQKPDVLVDAGRLPKSKTSTVVDLTVWPPLILRAGEVEINEAE